MRQNSQSRTRPPPQPRTTQGNFVKAEQHLLFAATNVIKAISITANVKVKPFARFTCQPHTDKYSENLEMIPYFSGIYFICFTIHECQ